MKIKIWKTNDEGSEYKFNVWRDPDATDDDQCDGDGQCAGTYKEALDMAASRARELLEMQ